MFGENICICKYMCQCDIFWTNKPLLHCNYYNYCKDTVNFALAGQRERDEEVGRRPQWHLKTQVFETKYLKNEVLGIIFFEAQFN